MLKDKLVKKKAKIGVIGLGYVGLPLAVEFANSGFSVIGVDTSKKRISSISAGSSYILDVKSADVKKHVISGRLRVSFDYEALKDADAVIICVPTPLRKTKEPDLSYVIKASKGVVPFASKGRLIVLESTTYPGTTEEVLLPMFSQDGKRAGKDFYLAFSPERVDPANKNYKTKDIPKVVGGVTPKCAEMTKLLYSQIIKDVILVSSTKVAEMVKLLENTFRSANIALANEMALMCNKLGIDVWEVIEAAKTKPFGFMAFYPGPGIGGHCIPLDPLYLTWKARLNGFEPKFIELASEINSYMPRYVVERLTYILNEDKKTLNDSKILLVGVAYKKDVNDLRESPAIEVMKELLKRGARVSYHDPYVSEAKIGKERFASSPLEKDVIKNADCVVILTDHSKLDYDIIRKNARLILDTRNALKGRHGKRGRMVKL